MTDDVFDAELAALLEALYRRYHHDFRCYARASMKRRLLQAMERLAAPTLSRLQERVLREPEALALLLSMLTVPVSEMFRDPPFYRALRQQVVPFLRTYPSLKVWVAGCSTGEEVYSVAIVLREEGLSERTLIYATDVNQDALRVAELGIYALEQVRSFSESYLASGGRGSLSDYYTAGEVSAVFDKTLRKDVVFSDHSLATDSVFAEVQLVTCRNVLIYFGRELQDRALGLFADALCPLGFLGLGSKETVRFSRHASRFTEVSAAERIYRRA